MRPRLHISSTPTRHAHEPCHSERSEESKVPTGHKSQHLRFFATLRMTGERWHAPANKVRNLAFVWLFTLALSFILVGCDFEEPKPEPPIPILIITPDPTATPASVIVHLPDSKELRLITIDDSWGGYSRPSALSASYTLTSTTEG